MLYYDFEAGNNAYKLRLGLRDIVNLEKDIKCYPLMVFGTGGDNLKVPQLSEMLAILHHSLQAYHHGVTRAKAEEIFMDFLADGHTPADFVQHILGIYRVSGIISQSTDTTEPEEDNEKN